MNYWKELRDWLEAGAPEDKSDGHVFNMNYEWLSEDDSCGSVCCMAGYVVYRAFLDGLSDHPETVKRTMLTRTGVPMSPIIAQAGIILGMDRHTALKLFYPASFDLWAEPGARITPAQALRTMRYYEATGIVDWDEANAVSTSEEMK
jgi:hypothetical protein